MIEAFNVRGVIAHLNESIKTIVSQHPYPKQIQKLLGETLLTASLLLPMIKLKGRMIIQFQSDGAIKMLVAQINDQGHIRGLAKWQPDAKKNDLISGLENGELVITIFQKGQEKPYQSIVPLYNKDISTAMTHYFVQSEQLLTKCYLTVSDDSATGMLLQMMPENENIDRELQWQSLMSHMKDFNVKKLTESDNVTFLKTTDARHGERSEGAYSAVGSDFLPSVSDCKKSLRAVKSFESPCVVEP
ncbi:Hsp33 family molecular chaperone HslO [Candidiatus Paracoxiella cheracis]|uniref:Hsp33 family molecular chaperone HslO n=1 Tax=Candidiatus Paracoxiella cheracis TaxID=3405120 RepID=UPI003BF5E218